MRRLNYRAYRTSSQLRAAVDAYERMGEYFDYVQVRAEWEQVQRVEFHRTLTLAAITGTLALWLLPIAWPIILLVLLLICYAWFDITERIYL